MKKRKPIENHKIHIKNKKSNFINKKVKKNFQKGNKKILLKAIYLKKNKKFKKTQKIKPIMKITMTILKLFMMT